MGQDSAYEKNIKLNIIVTGEDARLCGCSEKSITPIFMVAHRGNQIRKETVGMLKVYTYIYFQLLSYNFFNTFINIPPCCS